MKIFTIDLNNVWSADELHDLLRETLPLPDYYGGTLDALHDVLTDVSEDWEIRWTSVKQAEAVMGKYIRNLKKMCLHAAEENLHVTFQFED